MNDIVYLLIFLKMPLIFQLQFFFSCVTMLSAILASNLWHFFC